MKKHRFLMWLTFLFISVVSGYAQQMDISGRVLDSNKEPLIGVTVLLKGSASGTVTDIDGNFSIKASKGETLVISYIGYKTQEILLSSDKATLIVELLEDSEMLDEVVVIGYGTMRKKDLTGSVTQVRPWCIGK